MNTSKGQALANAARPGTSTDPCEEVAVPMTIQLPPLSSSRTGPPQTLVRQALERRPRPRDCNIRPSKGGHRPPVTSEPGSNGYRPRLTPRHLIRIVAKGQSSTDLIHTQSTSALGISGTFRPGSNPSRPAQSHRLDRNDAAARSARGRRPGKHETVQVTTRVVGCILQQEFEELSTAPFPGRSALPP